MSKLNNLSLQDVENAIDSWVETTGSWWELEAHNEGYPIPGLEGLKLEVLVEEGGEGSGYEIELVFTLSASGKTRYFKKYGHHISHDGTYWDGEFEEVRPQEKTVTVYE